MVPPVRGIMGHRNISRLSTLVLVVTLVFTKIDLLNGRCVEYVLSGDTCECPKPIPFDIEVPVPKPPIPSLPKEHIYKVEVPSIQRAKVKYSLDFQVEQPTPPLPPSLPGPPLSGYVDRIQIRKADCYNYPTKSSCSCGRTPCSCGTNLNSCSCGQRSCSCWSNRCSSCGSNPCSCGGSKCSCGTSPCSCSSKDNYPFFKGCGMNYQVPVNYLRVRRDLGANKDFKKSSQNIKKEDNLLDRKSCSKKLSKREIFELNEDIQMPYGGEDKINFRIPEVIQYMPEVLSSNFEQGKCFACKNSKTSCNHGRTFGDVFTCEPKVTPVDHIPNYVEYIHGSPVSYEPRMPNLKKSDKPRFVYDRLGHKYEENQGRLKLVTPPRSESDPVLGSPKESDPKMEDLIRSIIRSHPDFIEASDLGPGVLSPSAQVQNRDAMAFLRRILREKMSKALQRNRPYHGNDDYSYEDSSLERPYRSPDKSKNLLGTSQDIPEESNSFSLEESVESPLKFHNPGESNLQASQGNEIHVVKFKKDGKTLQVLTANSRN